MVVLATAANRDRTGRVGTWAGALTAALSRWTGQTEQVGQSPRQVLTRDQILEPVWGMDADGESNVLAVYIKYLRDKLDRPFGCTSLVTVRGLGYRWDPDDDPSL